MFIALSEIFLIRDQFCVLPALMSQPFPRFIQRVCRAEEGRASQRGQKGSDLESPNRGWC